MVSLSYFFFYLIIPFSKSVHWMGWGLKYAYIFESANKTNCGLCFVFVVIRCTSQVEQGRGT
jgi:hypothetical protein